MESISFFDDLVDEYVEKRKNNLLPTDLRVLRNGLIEKLLHEGRLGWRQDG